MTKTDELLREFADRWGHLEYAPDADMYEELCALIKQVEEERMPSEMTFEKAEIAAKETDYACFAVEPEGNEINFADAAAFYLEGWNACRSRLTEKPNNSERQMWRDIQEGERELPE